MNCAIHGQNMQDECICRGARYWMDRALQSEDDESSREQALVAAAYEAAALVTETCRKCACLVQAESRPYCADSCSPTDDSDGGPNLAQAIRAMTHSDARAALAAMVRAE